MENDDVYGASKDSSVKKTIQRAILKFEHQDKSGTRGRQGDLEKDSLCEA